MGLNQHELPDPQVRVTREAGVQAGHMGWVGPSRGSAAGHNDVCAAGAGTVLPVTLGWDRSVGQSFVVTAKRRQEERRTEERDSERRTVGETERFRGELWCWPGRRPKSHSAAPPAAEPQCAMTDVPYSDVDRCLRALAGAAEGFGQAAIGGLNGAIFHVTSLADEGPGTLREACKTRGPLWIVFEVSGVIHLKSYMRVSSYKTIDGRGQQVKLMGKGLQLKECEHVIVCNLEFEGGRGHDVDGIQMKPNSKHIWVDRCTLQDFDDGLIDITRKCTDVTISRCHFLKHDKTMLIGADPNHIEDRIIRVTIHHCLFDACRQRHPRLRFGKVHLYNNYTRNWGLYAVCASVEAQILSQCNIYEAGSNKVAFEYYTEKAADKDLPATGNIRSEGDSFLKGAQGNARNPHEVFKPESFYPHWTLEPSGDALMKKICRIAGWQSCRRPPDLLIS